MNATISPFPYYGGKARMAEFIAERLDYDSTSVYLEPFGGAARVLLNKPRHDVEIYNDYSTCLTIFFEVMTDEEKTEELIEKLLDEYYPPSPELFNKAYSARIMIDDEINTDLDIETKKIIRKYCNADKGLEEVFENFRLALQIKYYPKILECYEILLNSGIITDNLQKIWIQGIHDTYEEYWKIIKDKFEEGCMEYSLEKENREEQEKLKKMKEEKPDKYNKEILKRSVDCGHNRVKESFENQIAEYYLSQTTDIDIAAYIFILHYCSRDGMGTYWSEVKNENKSSYSNAVSNLRKISERMQGVEIGNSVAEAYINMYLGEKEVMMYLDPSYLSEDEKKDLGEVYKAHYGIKNHKELLEMITAPDVKAKIMISNYNSALYNKMLEGWRKVEFETFTSVGMKASKRTECIWTNY